MNKEQIIKEHYIEMAKLSHIKSPRSKEFYARIQKKSVKSRARNKKLKQLSTPPIDNSLQQA